MPRARVGASNDLNRMPMNGGANVRAGRRRDPPRRPDRIRVLDVVAAVAVAVLEVDAQVLDGLAPELAIDERPDLFRDAPGDADVEGQRLGAARGGERVAGVPSPLDRQLGGVPIARHVDRVHRLARAVVARVGGREQPIGRGQSGLDRGEHGRRQGGAHAHSSSS
jgi:hypothetical protein